MTDTMLTILTSNRALELATKQEIAIQELQHKTGLARSNMVVELIRAGTSIAEAPPLLMRSSQLASKSSSLNFLTLLSGGRQSVQHLNCLKLLYRSVEQVGLRHRPCRVGLIFPDVSDNVRLI